MAIFIAGARCAISGRTINSVEEAVMFPPFVQNEADPLYVFSDAVLHADVFRDHPLSQKALARLEEVRRRTAYADRICVICKKLITDPDDYYGLGHIQKIRIIRCTHGTTLTSIVGVLRRGRH